MMAPMLVPPTRSMGMPASRKRLHDADVRESPRAAAREHDAHCLTGDEARDPRYVLRRNDMVMGNARLHGLPRSGGAAEKCDSSCRSTSSARCGRCVRIPLIRERRPFTR